MAEFKKMWTEEEINKVAKTIKPGEEIRIYGDKTYPDYAELSSKGLIIDFTKTQGDGTTYTCKIGTQSDSFAIIYYENEETKGTLTLNGEAAAIEGTDIYIGGYAMSNPNSITLAKNPRQPSIELTGNLTKRVGGENVGTYTIRYVPVYDENGNIVSGCGTIALNFPAEGSYQYLNLTSEPDFKMNGSIYSNPDGTTIAFTYNEVGLNLNQEIADPGTYEGSILLYSN